VVISVNFTGEQQVVNMGGGKQPKAGSLRVLLESPGVPDLASLDRNELGPYGVFLGEIR
jgi:hypothetical protein